MDPIDALIARRFPHATVTERRTLGIDEGASDATSKGAGYGVPVRIGLREPDGVERAVVLHTARADEFGHDRRADRAAAMLLAYDTYGRLPQHVPALDVGVITETGELRSIADATELYLLTGWGDGELYAGDLRRIARDGATARDRRRGDALVDAMVALHAQRVDRPVVYTRAVRDLLGSGEGIFGMVDGYGDDVPAAPPARLRAIEEQCLAWRWRLRGRPGRAAAVHGDLHPFNILFRDDHELTLLDASRGAAGEPGDDVAALTINHVFFALDTPGAWDRGLGELWHRTWSRYLERSGDGELLDVVAPWLAWRALVIANPRWYPQLSAGARDRLLGWIERALAAPRFALASADEVAR